MKCKLKNVRLAFPALHTPKSMPNAKLGDEPKYSATFIIEPGSENAKVLAAAVDQVSKEKWLAKAPAILKDLKSKDRVAYRESDKTNASGDVYDGFEGKHWINSTTKVKPLVLNNDLSKIEDASIGRPYGGCEVNATIDVYALDKAGEIGKRICATLKAVQFARDGEPFAGGAPASTDDFEEVAEESLAD